MSNEFEILAKLHGLSVKKNKDTYLDPKTELASIFWYAQQMKIDSLINYIAIRSGIKNE